MNRLLLSLAIILFFTFSCKEKKDNSIRNTSGNQVTEFREGPSPLMLSNPEGEQKLRDASLEGDAAAVGALLADNVNVNAIDEGGRTALMLASFNAHVKIMQELISRGAMVNITDYEGRTALMYASTGSNLEAVSLLLAHKAEVNIADKAEGFTALMFAASEGHQEVVKLLLKNKANPDLVDKDNDDAETFARQNGHIEIADLLKSYKK